MSTKPIVIIMIILAVLITGIWGWSLFGLKSEESQLLEEAVVTDTKGLKNILDTINNNQSTSTEEFIKNSKTYFNLGFFDNEVAKVKQGRINPFEANNLKTSFFSQPQKIK